MARMGLVCSFIGSFGGSDLRDALGGPLCPRRLGRQRSGAAHLLVLAGKHCFPLPGVGSLWNKLQPPLPLFSYVFAPKGSVVPAPRSATYLPAGSLTPRVCRVCSWEGAPRFSCAVHYRALSKFSWQNEFVAKYQGLWKKEKMSIKTFWWSSIVAFIYDFLISSVKVFGVFFFISFLL